MAETPEKPDDAGNAGSELDENAVPNGDDREASGDGGEAAGTPEDDPASGAGYGNNAGQQ